MKKYDILRLSGIVLLTHLALCAAVFLLLAAASGSTSSFTFRSSCGLALGLLLIAAPSFVLGWGLRPKAPLPRNICWNAAMVFYVLNAAAFLLSPEPLGGALLPMLWGLPMTPALTGLSVFAAPQSVPYLFLGALLAAAEPLGLTLGLLSGRRAESTAKPGDPPAETEETTDNKENMPHA